MLGMDATFPGDIHMYILTNMQASFSYGSYLVYFNIMNGTASIILGGEPYNFGSVFLLLGQ